MGAGFNRGSNAKLFRPEDFFDRSQKTSLAPVDLETPVKFLSYCEIGKDHYKI
jgi:hypothetical protein